MSRGAMAMVLIATICIGTLIGVAVPQNAGRESDDVRAMVGSDRVERARDGGTARRGAKEGAPTASGTFTVCHIGGGINCVVDGDTAWIDGLKVRLADIDAPETHPPRCEFEADLGEKATKRLAELMSAGPFEQRSADRDVDRYGRRLRVLTRDGRSLGDQLVQEGLARAWEGRRRPWC